MKITTKINIVLVTLSVLAVIVTSISFGYVSYNISLGYLKNDRQADLEVYRDLKAEEVEDYFSTLESEVLAFSKSTMIVNATKEFIDAFEKYNDDIIFKGQEPKYKKDIIDYYANQFSAEFEKQSGSDSLNAASLLNFLDPASFSLQYHYIINNPNDLKNKRKLESADDGSVYSEVHKKYHAKIREIIDGLGFKDLLIIDDSGRVVYSVEKELDFAASLKNSSLKDTSLGKVYAAAKKLVNPNAVVISDFIPYPPSYNKSAAFMATTLQSASGEIIGVVVFELLPQNLNDIITNNQKWKDIGLGNTGELYIVGSDQRYRTKSRLMLSNFSNYIKSLEKSGLSQSDIDRIKVTKNNINIQNNNSVVVRNAVLGKKGVESYINYNGVEIVSAYKPLNIKGLEWVIVASMDAKEAFIGANYFRDKIIKIAFILIGVVSVLAFILGNNLKRLIVNPIRDFSNTMAEISSTKDLTRTINYNNPDELGFMAKAFNDLLKSIQEICIHTKKSTKQIKSYVEKLDAKARIESDPNEPRVHKDRKEKNLKPSDDNDAFSEEDSESSDLEESLKELDMTLDTIDLDKDAKDSKLGYHDDYHINSEKDEIDSLCNKLYDLANEFKILEEEHERKSDW